MSEARRIEFVYFDLGNVLIGFDHRIASRAISQLVSADPDEVHAFVFESGLELEYERGDLTSREFHERICQRFAPCDFAALMLAAADIFEPWLATHRLVDRLADRAAGCRLGLLSNTCEAHWQFCLPRYPVLTHFEVYALSFELRRLKPEPEIYRLAAELAGVEPERIFFVDDRAENVEAACVAGFDAVPFLTAERLEADLEKRGLLGDG